ncbi:two-component regulator propeller domain-containing protein [Balneolales bacterium ANBcel1]|nr:two-component regulator propeller domain-containing protein [Balneolales bacterium ANBcel1]
MRKALRYNGLGLLASLAFSLFAITLPVIAQEPLFKENLRFYHITAQDGLSQSTIEAIWQDHQGYMWFGSQDGLNKYNGHDITVYKNNPDYPGSISYNEITDIFEDSDDNLWISTSGRGFNRYNRNTESFTRYVVVDTALQYGPSENTANSLVKDRDGYIWIATEQGLNRFSPETELFDHYFADPEDPTAISDNRVTKLLVDSRDNLWIGTRNGLALKEPDSDSFRQIYHDPDDPGSLGANHIWDIFEGRDGMIWIGTRGGGLNKYNPENGTFTSYKVDENDPHSIRDNSVRSLFEDSRGVLWVGGETNGLHAFDRDNNRFYHYEHDPRNPTSLSFDAVYSLYESSNQILWVGTYSGGINYIDLKPQRFEFYELNPFQEHTLSNNNILSFWEEPDGTFWVGTDGGGLNRFNRQTGEFFALRHDPDDPNSIPNDAVLDITSCPDGYLWIGTYMGGLTRIDRRNGEFKHFQSDPDDIHSLNINDVYRLHFTDEELWIGTHGGGLNIMDLETGKFRHYVRDENDPNSLENNYIQAIYEDRNGTMWIGTHGGGLAMYHPENENFTIHTEFNNRLSSIVVTAIYEDRQGRFWVGTNNGLNLFDRETETYQVYTMDDGLANNFINGILPDDDGNLWLSTNNGISKFYPDSGEFENYRSESGLQGNEFNVRSHFRDRDGYNYFGGVNGFNRFHPDNVAPDTYVAPVVFTNFMIFNQPVPIGGDSPLQKHISQTDHITLSHDQSVLTFEFVTLNFEIQKNDRFAYILEGFDQDWNLIWDKRSATYTNLRPGDYKLHVIASNSDGILGTQGASLGITIIPPFWQTLWFYLLAGLSITGLIYGIYRRRVYSISEQNRLLEEQVKNRTLELDERNKTLNQTLEELQSTRDELIEKAHKAGMADVATSVLHDVGNILNSVNVSTAVISETIKQSHLLKLRKANALLKENIDSLDEFVLKNPKGRDLLHYYIALDDHLASEYQKLEEQNQRLTDKINLIIDVVSAQQNYSMAVRLEEECKIEEVLEDALKIISHNFLHHGIIVHRDYKKTNPVLIQKTKMIHILVNVLKNAMESIAMQDPGKKEITISLRQKTDSVTLGIRDTGTGFDRSTGAKIFTHGFSSKPGGHGYGLHGCANYIKEMDGSIAANSDGPGKGAIFTLKIPCKKQKIRTSGADE